MYTIPRITSLYTMYEIPMLDSVREVHIQEEVIREQAKPLYVLDGEDEAVSA